MYMWLYLMCFSGFMVLFSSRLVTSKWPKFEYWNIYELVVSVIKFVLVMNLVDGYIRVNILKAIQYYESDYPVPLMKFFMDDACLLTAVTCDMNNVLIFPRNL